MTQEVLQQVSLRKFNGEISAFIAASSKPLLAHVVANGVVGDSRVIKSAVTSRDLGLNTVIVGFGPKARVGSIQGIPVFIAPMSRKLRRESAALTNIQAIDPASAALKDWLEERHNAAMLRENLQQNSWLKASGNAANVAKLQLRKKKRMNHQDAQEQPTTFDDKSTWWLTKNSSATVATYAILPVLNRLQPDGIHAHDIIPLQIAAFFSGLQKLKRKQFGFVYDAHEYVAGLADTYPHIWDAYLKMEQTYIGLSSSIITVSDAIAVHLRETYSLETLPGVVANSPTLDTVPAPNLRKILDLEPDIPVMVYSGWIDNKRGVDTAVTALRQLTKVHLVLVVGNLLQADEAVSYAKKIGVADRIHVAGYVRPEQITSYLHGIDIGLIPLGDYPNHRVSLPTKFREYLMADIPLVVSDVGEMSRAKQLGIGEMFTSGNSAELAQAVSKILENPRKYKERITDELLWEMSWESSVSILAKAYQSLFPKENLTATPAVEQSGIKTRLTSSFSTLDEGEQFQALQRFDISLTIGPYNNAGQASMWNKAVARQFGIRTYTMAYKYMYRYPVDVPMTKGSGVPPDLNQRLRHVRLNTSHLLIDSFDLLFAGLLNSDPIAEASFLRSMDKQIAYVAHGSDIRTPSMHREHFEFSYFNETPEEWNQEHETATRRRQLLAKELEAPLFISTPDLKLYLPTAQWLPLAVDLEDWRTQNAALTNKKPRVLHLPSRTEPPIKGTEHIDRVMQHFHENNLIDYVRPERCTHKEMNAHIKEADIVVDQILTGSYGVTAVEAMAAGRLVIGNVGSMTRSLLEDEPPIIDADPTSLADVMTKILDEREQMQEVALEGTSYTTKWHNGEKSAAALQNFLFR